MSQSDYVVTMSAVNAHTSRLNPTTTQVAALVMACTQTNNFKGYFSDDNKDVLFSNLLQYPHAIKGLDCAYKNLDKALAVYRTELATIDPTLTGIGLRVAKEECLVNTLIRTGLVKPCVTTSEQDGVHTVVVNTHIDNKRWVMTFKYDPANKGVLPMRTRTEVNGIDTIERPISGEVAILIENILNKVTWSVFKLEMGRIDGKLVA